MKALSHPLLRLSRVKRIVLFLVAAVLTFVLLTAIRTLDAQLWTPAAGWGMLSFQFAKTPERSTEIIKSWDLAAQKNAESSLLLNFLFPLCYSTMLTLGCLWASRLFHERGFHKTGFLSTTIAWAQWPAAVCDLLENVALWVQLNQTAGTDPWPKIAYFCALIKFAAVLTGLGILAAALLTSVLRRRAVVTPVTP
jgi:hypothetical protein